MEFKIYCLMSKGMVTDGVRDVLFDTAQDMVQKKKSRYRISRESFEGEVTTKGKTACIGSVSGIVFHALVETQERRVQLSFIVRESDVRAEDNDELFWEPCSLCDLAPENACAN